MSGLGLTFTLSGVAIAGSLLVGVILGTLHAAVDQARGLGALLGLPVRAIITLARMTPPILQLYIVFFGVGGLLTSADLASPSAFVIAGIILSFYAGATNAVLISHALRQEQHSAPGIPLHSLVGRALVRAYDGLVSTCVNIVKGAGMASVIALTELVSTVNLIITEGGSAATLMNALLVTYFLFVMVVLIVFRSAKRLLTRDITRRVPGE
jgi:polar amino acid transport system substrate-binding protein